MNLRFNRIAVILALVVVFAGATWVVMAARLARVKAREANCLSNLRYISIMLENYRMKFGRIPPAFLKDGAGNKLCSWRVLVLACDPAFQNIYNSYNFSQPWDGVANRELARNAPVIYTCPNSTQIDNSSTSYLALVGPGTAFNAGVYGINRDETRQEIVIVESADSGINWMEPRDIAIDGRFRGIETIEQVGVSSRDPLGPGVVLSNGVNTRLGPGIALDQFKTLIGADKGVEQTK